MSSPDTSYTATARNFFTNTLIDWSIQTRDTGYQKILPKKVDGVLGRIQKSTYVETAGNWGFNRKNALIVGSLGFAVLGAKWYASQVDGWAPLSALAANFALSGSGNAFRASLKLAAIAAVTLAVGHYMMQEAEPTPYNP